MRLVFAIIVLLMSLSEAFAADVDEKKVVQFTGVVVEGDSLQPIPFTHVIVKNSNIGTITDYYGFFSFVAHEGDTISFSSIGYQKNEFIIPDTLKQSRYSIIHMMTKDTVLLNEVVIYPWPTLEQFKQAFLSLKVPDDDLQRARRNLSRERMMILAENVPIDGSTTYKYELQNRYTRLYQAGGYPSISLLNPLAWAQFIKAWKNGDFKKKGNINYTPN